ncbi:hypothetical protein NFI96_016439 [Prochilodus magdalenae]|nr:hypothetical protein NFI96_016439 [Prochilodus magdalenae]
MDRTPTGPPQSSPCEFLCDVNTEELKAADPLYSSPIDGDGGVHSLLLHEVHYQLLGLVDIERKIKFDYDIGAGSGCTVVRLQGVQEKAEHTALWSSSAKEIVTNSILILSNSELSFSLLREDHFRCSLCTDVLKDPVSIPCGHSYCKTCIQNYWTKPTLENSYSCPQCRKRFRTRPALNPNPDLAKVVQKLQKAGFSPALPAHCYAGPGDVACDFCTGRKLRAVKSCLTCSASYCETHVKQHYTVATLQRHMLVEVTGELEQRLCKLHHRALEVFCKTDQTFICLICLMEEHKDHDTVLAKSEDPSVEVGSYKNQGEKVFLLNSTKEANEEKQMMQLLEENRELTSKVEVSLPSIIHVLINVFISTALFSDFTSEFVEVSALGRSLDLGMLYDCHDDSFSSDVFLWDADSLSSMRLSLPRLCKDVKILEEDSLQERLEALNLTSALRASVVSGLVEVAGATVFLKHPTKSQLHDRVTIRYRTSTRLDMLSHRLLHSAAFQSVTNGNSTHVVVAVLYGAQAFFVFDNTKERKRGTTELRSAVEKMISSSCATECFSCLSESEKASCLLYDCTVYLDEHEVKSPVRFDTAVKLYDSLEKLLGTQSERAVPLKVWLYPLKNLEETAPNVVRDISTDLTTKAENFLEFVEGILRSCQDMLYRYSQSNVMTWFPALKEDVCQFYALLQQYKSVFQLQLSFSIKSIRESGEEGEENLRDFLKRNEQSSFSPHNMQWWLQNKDAEVRALNECGAANITIVKSRKDLKRIVEDSPADRVLCFTLTSLESENPIFSALKQHIDVMNTFKIIQTQPPLHVSDISQKIRSDLNLFLSKTKTDQAQLIKFIAASIPDQEFPGSSIRLYQSRCLVSRNVKLEVVVEEPEIILISETSLTLKLERSKTKCTNRYKVEYRVVENQKSPADMQWKVIEISSNTQNCVVLGLKPETQYHLRYAVMDGNSMSDYSRITEFQTLPRARPAQPTVLKQHKDFLTVSWPRAGNHSLLCYMVEYLEAGLDGWQSILTEVLESECTITCPYSTCHRVRVSAVYGQADTSKPSEETEVPLHMWYIDLKKRRASLFLEVLKLQTEKKPVELRAWSDEESEVRSFLQCLPYISQLRYPFMSDINRQIQVFLDLLIKTAECERQTGEKMLELLTSVCSYSSFPYGETHRSEQSTFLLDLYSHVKDYETQSGRSVFPALQPVYQSVPAVWIINLSERKSSLLLEVLKLQTVKKPVELRGWPDEEGEVRSFLQCLPYISQLR